MLISNERVDAGENEKKKRKEKKKDSFGWLSTDRKRNDGERQKGRYEELIYQKQEMELKQKK